MAIELPDARHLTDETLQQLRLRALRGIELGYSEVELAELLGVSNVTISHWWTLYQAKGLQALPAERTGRPQGTGRFLSDEQAQYLRGCINSHLPQELGLAHALWTRRAVGDLIRQQYHIDLADRTVGTYLRRWGYTPKKPSRRSRRQDPDELEQWLEDTYPAIEEQAERENAEILWTDETGVQADHQPGRGYAPQGERSTMGVPAPHIHVNQIAAISNAGTVRFMTYQGALDAALFLVFLQRLLESSTRKILLIADGLRAHKTPEVEAFVEAHREQLAIFYLPSYSPQLNPVEYLNNDLKGQVNATGLPENRPALQERVVGFMERLSRLPRHVVSYFLHPWTQYAAPVELLQEN
jgi:transposase